MSVEILRRIGERVGLIESPRKKEAELAKFRELQESIERSTEERLKRIRMLVNHSDACLGEIEYILGISNRDPHPDHPI